MAYIWQEKNAGTSAFDGSRLLAPSLHAICTFGAFITAGVRLQ